MKETVEQYLARGGQIRVFDSSVMRIQEGKKKTQKEVRAALRDMDQKRGRARGILK